MEWSSEEVLAAFFRSLGNPVRMRILLLLQMEGELNVGQLVERVGLTQGHVSNHLCCLRTCGAVATRQEKRSVYYRLASDEVRQILDVARLAVGDRAAQIIGCPVLKRESIPDMDRREGSEPTNGSD